MFLFVSGRNLYADACLVFGHYGVVEAGNVDTFFLHAGGINLGKFGIIQHDGADGALCRLDVEASGSHFVAEVIHVFQQFVMQGITLFKHLEYLETGADDTWRQ